MYVSVRPVITMRAQTSASDWISTAETSTMMKIFAYSTNHGRAASWFWARTNEMPSQAPNSSRQRCPVPSHGRGCEAESTDITLITAAAMVASATGYDHDTFGGSTHSHIDCGRSTA